MSHATVNPDKELLIQCPYDPVHMISQMRFPYHLIKCRKNHNGKEFSQCPFDAKHVIPKSKFQDHLQTCDKRAIIEPQLVLDNSRNLEHLLPESKADQIHAHLSNEWDLETRPIPTKTSVEVNSFASSFNPEQSVGHSSSSGKWNNRHVTGQTASEDNDGSFKESVLPRKPNSYEKMKETCHNVQNPSNSTIGRGFCKKSSHFPSINATSSTNLPKSFGRGRALCNKEFNVFNQESGPASYEVNPDTDETTRNDVASMRSFGRGRQIMTEQQGSRRPGTSGKSNKEVLEKERLKLLKKIRETKILEDKAAKGEVLEENQISKMARLEGMQCELKKICRQLEDL
ncbi:hypothetical protein ACHWQZ_G002692 [Mnemiopsis leidyi]